MTINAPDRGKKPRQNKAGGVVRHSDTPEAAGIVLHTDDSGQWTMGIVCMYVRVLVVLLSLQLRMNPRFRTVPQANTRTEIFTYRCSETCWLHAYMHASRTAVIKPCDLQRLAHALACLRPPVHSSCHVSTIRGGQGACHQVGMESSGRAAAAAALQTCAAVQSSAVQRRRRPQPWACCCCTHLFVCPPGWEYGARRPDSSGWCVQDAQFPLVRRGAGSEAHGGMRSGHGSLDILRVRSITTTYGVFVQKGCLFD